MCAFFRLQFSSRVIIVCDHCAHLLPTCSITSFPFSIPFLPHTVPYVFFHLIPFRVLLLINYYYYGRYNGLQQTKKSERKKDINGATASAADTSLSSCINIVHDSRESDIQIHLVYFLSIFERHQGTNQTDVFVILFIRWNDSSETKYIRIEMK